MLHWMCHPAGAAVCVQLLYLLKHSNITVSNIVVYILEGLQALVLLTFSVNGIRMFGLPIQSQLVLQHVKIHYYHNPMLCRLLLDSAPP